MSPNSRLIPCVAWHTNDNHNKEYYFGFFRCYVVVFTKTWAMFALILTLNTTTGASFEPMGFLCVISEKKNHRLYSC